jgi:hypothetical protein
MVINLPIVCFSFPKPCDILKDRYQFIFIGEYQDSTKEVKIFLAFKSQKKKI